MKRRTVMKCLGCAAALGATSHTRLWPEFLGGVENAFAFDLYRAAASGEDDLVLSPASVSVAMAMTWAGARGRTAEQMAEALHFELPQERLHPAMARLRSDLLDEVAGVELAVANRLWGQQGAAFLDPFLAVTRDSYGAQTVEADFAGDPEGVRADINRWVDEQTRHRIPDLLQPGTIEPLTRLVLANAIAFEGQWKFKFPAERTQSAPFTRTDGSQVQAPLMQVKLPTALYQGEGFQVLALPYQGDEVEMVVVLPEQHDGLAALEARVDGDTLQTWLGEATTGDVVADEMIRATVPGVSMRAFLEAVQVHAMMLGVDLDDRKAMLDVASGVSRSMVETAKGLQELLVDRAAFNGGPVATALKLSEMLRNAIQTGVRPGDGTVH